VPIDKGPCDIKSFMQCVYKSIVSIDKASVISRIDGCNTAISSVVERVLALFGITYIKSNELILSAFLHGRDMNHISLITDTSTT